MDSTLFEDRKEDEGEAELDRIVEVPWLLVVKTA